MTHSFLFGKLILIFRPTIDCLDDKQAKALQLMVSSVRDLYRDSEHTLRE